MTSPFDAYFDGLEAKSAKRSAVQIGAPGQPDPDTAAEAIVLGRAVGLPASVVAGAPEVFRPMAEQKRNATALQGALRTQDWVQDAMNAALAKDDIENLTWFERYGRQRAEIPKTLKRRGQEAAQGFSQVFEGVLRSRAIKDETLADNIQSQAPERVVEAQRQVDAFREILESGVSPASGEPLNEQETAVYQQRLTEAQTAVEQWSGVDESGPSFAGNRAPGAEIAAENIAETFDDFFGVPPQDDSIWSDLAYGTGSMAAFLLPAIVPGGIVATAQMGADSARVEAYDRAIAFGASETDAQAAATIAGFMGTSEALPIATALRALPSPLRNKLMGRIGRVLAEGAAGSIEEGLQEGLSAIGQNLIAQGIYDPEQQILTEDVGRQAIVGAILGGFLSGGVEAVSPSRSVQDDISASAQAGETASALDALDEMAGQSKLRQRSPDHFEEALKQQGLDAEGIYVAPEDLRELYQAKDLAFDDEALREIGIDPQAFEEAEAAGSDVSIPYSVYAARIAGTDMAAWVRENGTTADGELSLKQAQEFNAKVDDIMAEEFERLQQDFDAEQQSRASDVQVYDRMYEQLRAAGRGPDVAQREASVWQAFFRTMAERTGDDALELARTMGVEVRGPQESVTLDEGEADGKTYSQNEIDLESLIEFADRAIAADAPVVPELGHLDSYPAAIPPEYEFSNFRDIGGKMSEMSPDEFLALSSEMSLDEDTMENVRYLAQMMVDGRKIDPPRLSVGSGGRIDSHDGRHRALAAKSLGIERLPVLLMGESGGAYPDGVSVLKAQSGSADRDVTVGARILYQTDFYRVMPRDLFNEAKLLSMLMKVADDFNAGRLPEGFEVFLPDGEREVGLTDDGDLYLSGVEVFYQGEPVQITVRYNAGKTDRFPVQATAEQIDVWGVPIYGEDGNFDDEFVEAFPTGPAMPEQPVETPDAWVLERDFMLRLGAVGLWEADRMLPNDFVFDLADGEDGFKIANIDGEISSSNLITSANGVDVEFIYDEASGELKFRTDDDYGPVLNGPRDMSDQFRKFLRENTSDEAWASNTTRELFQTRRGSIVLPRGGLTEGQTVINLFESADLSSFLHESGHFFLEALRFMAKADGAPQGVADDLTAVYEFLGADTSDGFGDLTTEQHEKFARAFEAYAMEGKAPSLALSDAFSRFKQWLTRIYRTARGLNVKITPEIREVFDRMLATDEEIRAARNAQEMSPLFSKEKPPGMSDTDFQAYQRMARRSEQQAEERLLKKTMDRIRREREAWFKDEKRQVRENVEAQVNGRREYRLIEMLANKRWLDADEQAEPIDVQIDKATLIEMFGEDVTLELNRTRLGGKRAIYGADGAHPREVADLFGFASAQEMVEALRSAGKRTEVISNEVDRIMLERHGDPFTDGSIEEEALAAIHSEQQAKTAVAEARHFARQLGRSTGTMQSKLYRQRARLMLGRMTVRDAITPQRFLTAERKAARRAQDAFAKVSRQGGEAALSEALQAKEQQVLNGFFFDEARKLEKMVEKKREQMRGYGTKKVREKLDGGYIEQIDALLDQYDFRRRSKAQIGQSESLKAFVDRMIEEGRDSELAIDPRLIDEVNRRHYTTMSVDELQGLFDTIDNIDHLGRFKQKLVDAKRKRDLDKSVETLVENIRDNLGAGRAGEESRLRDAFNLVWSTDTILARMDGGEEIGTSYDEIKRSIDDGSVDEQRMSVELAEKMEDIFGVYSAKELAAMSKAREVPGANGREWSKLEILSVALNSGNADNMARLLEETAHEQNRLTKDQHEALLAQMDKRDWEFVQGMWNLIDGYWPMLSEVEYRRTGVKPKKVDAVPVETAHGVYRGGYYPIAYDPALAAAAMDDEKSAWDKFVSAGRGSRAAIKNGMVKERQKSSNGRTLKYDLQVPFSHLRDTIRMITLSEAVDNSYRLLNDRRVKQAFLDAGRRGDLEALNLWVKDVAQGPVYNRDFVNSLARSIKNNFTLSRLAFNFKTVVLQVTGIGQSAATIGKRNMLNGMLEYAKDPGAAIEKVLKASPFMAERQTSFQKDIYDFANDVKVASPIASRWSKARNVISQAGFLPIVKTQFLVVDVPTWIGAYNAELNASGDQDRAVSAADRMVARSQASGLMSDRSSIERGTLSENTRQSDLVRLFTTLGSYMIAKMNRGYMTAMQGSNDIKEADSAAAKVGAAANMATDLTLLYVFEAALMALMWELLAEEESEPEEIAQFVGVETAFAMTGGIPFVRDGVSALNGYGGGGIYGSVTELPFRVTSQIAQGEFDKSLRRALGDTAGLLTGLPTTASMRLIEGILDDDTSPAEMAFGSNPLDR